MDKRREPTSESSSLSSINTPLEASVIKPRTHVCFASQNSENTSENFRPEPTSSMKFFLELGACCRAPEPERETEASSVLLASGGRAPCSRGNTKRRSSRHWRPGLSVISEDGVVSVAETRRREKTAGSEIKSSQKGSRTGKVPRTSGGDDYSKLQLQMIVPAFSPTPFLF